MRSGAGRGTEPAVGQVLEQIRERQQFGNDAMFSEDVEARGATRLPLLGF